MNRMAVPMIVAAGAFAFGAQADLHLAPGTKIVFGDSSELASAPDPGGQIPPGHGGTGNTVSGSNAYVGGGQNNTASGIASTVPGGFSNLAQGNYSFAAGYRARSLQPGSMTLADSSSNNTFDNTIANSLRVRATGGVYFFTRLSGEVESFQVNGSGQGFFSDDLIVDGVVLAHDYLVASRPAGANEAGLVDNRALLDALASVPVQRYGASNGEPGGLGFAAEGIAGTLGRGEGHEGVSVRDLQAATIASIQALYDMVEERERRIGELEAVLDSMAGRLESLEAAGR